MTAQEKAKELVSKYYDILSVIDKYDHVLASDIMDSAKQCAIIAIDELLNDVDASSPFEIERLTFWKEVKQEIEKL